MIEVGRLKLMPPRGDDTAINQIPPTLISTCIEESIAENGKVFLIPFKLNSGNGQIHSSITWNVTTIPHQTLKLPHKIIKLPNCEVRAQRQYCFCCQMKILNFYRVSFYGWPYTMAL